MLKQALNSSSWLPMRAARRAAALVFLTKLTARYCKYVPSPLDLGPSGWKWLNYNCLGLTCTFGNPVRKSLHKGRSSTTCWGK
ncbi:hypothetical protein B0H11DRAFT_1121836 [Mycena galericulata]|nr:hypothetical protein B0H11DRAFT_1121836 [Mycena galericulata]